MTSRSIVKCGGPPTLYEHVNIEMISTSEIKISVVIELAKGEKAMKAVHAAFIGW